MSSKLRLLTAVLLTAFVFIGCTTESDLEGTWVLTNSSGTNPTSMTIIFYSDGMFRYDYTRTNGSGMVQNQEWEIKAGKLVMDDYPEEKKFEFDLEGTTLTIYDFFNYGTSSDSFAKDVWGDLTFEKQ